MGFVVFGFFDETGTHAGHPLTAVGGFVFDQAGLDHFEREWRTRTAELTEPFHAVDCFGGYKQFESWPKPQRLILMHDLAEIIVKNRVCGIFAFLKDEDYTQFSAENPEQATWVGSPYTCCLMKCVDIGASVAHQSNFNEMNYIFAAGAAEQEEAARFMARIDGYAGLKNHLRIGAYGFSTPWKEPALCAADFFVWEWQRNYTEDLTWGDARSEFKVLMPNPTQIYVQRLNVEGLLGQAMANAIHGVHLANERDGASAAQSSET